MKANPSPQGKPKHTGVLLKLTRELIMLTGVLMMQGSKYTECLIYKLTAIVIKLLAECN